MSLKKPKQRANTEGVTPRVNTEGITPKHTSASSSKNTILHQMQRLDNINEQTHGSFEEEKSIEREFKIEKTSNNEYSIEKTANTLPSAADEIIRKQREANKILQDEVRHLELKKKLD